MKTTNMPDIPDKTFLRPDEVAKIFSVSVRTVYNWQAEGKIDGVKVSDKCLRFPRKAVIDIFFIQAS